MAQRTNVPATAIAFTLFSIIILSGCGSYAVPGGAADFKTFGVGQSQGLTDQSVQSALNRKPLARFPTGIAAVRVQAPAYRSPTAQGYGAGAYSVVVTRDIETDEQMARLMKLPMVNGIAPVGRLLLPQQLNSDLELRQAAAELHADMVLIYTLDTTFNTDDLAAPLSVVTLGLFPSQNTRVVSTASAILMDTRNGYIYGIAEATETKTGLSSSWSTESAVDRTRLRAERDAFAKLVDELEKTWGGVLRQYAGAYQTK